MTKCIAVVLEHAACALSTLEGVCAGQTNSFAFVCIDDSALFDFCNTTGLNISYDFTRGLSSRYACLRQLTETTSDQPWTLSLNVFDVRDRTLKGAP